jgi:flavin-dependent dehydrogenase
MRPSFQRSSPPQATRLRDGAEIIVVGGGPAGSFFALRLLGSARQQGKEISVSIVDKNPEAGLSSAEQETCCKEGCNYCAGGLSPSRADAFMKD